MRDGGAYGCAVPRAYANLNLGLSIIACYFIAHKLLWNPRDIVQIAYHLRQKSPLHFATSHNTLQQSQLQSTACTLCVRKHTILCHEIHRTAHSTNAFSTVHFINLELKVGFWRLRPPDPNRGSAHGPRWGTHVRQIPSNLYPQPRKSS